MFHITPFHRSVFRKILRCFKKLVYILLNTISKACLLLLFTFIHGLNSFITSLYVLSVVSPSCIQLIRTLSVI